MQTGNHERHPLFGAEIQLNREIPRFLVLSLEDPPGNYPLVQEMPSGAIDAQWRSLQIATMENSKTNQKCVALVKINKPKGGVRSEDDTLCISP